MNTALVGLVGLVLLLGVVAGCDDDGGGLGRYAVDEQPTSSSSLTGLADLDRVLAAVLSGDVEEVRPLVAYSAEPCTITRDSLDAVPLCRDDEGDGRLVEVVPVAECEGFFLRPDEIDESLSTLVASDLYAAYQAPATSEPPGQYVAVFSHMPGDELLGIAVVIDGGRIVGMDFGCAQSPEAIVQSLGLREAVLPPS